MARREQSFFDDSEIVAEIFADCESDISCDDTESEYEPSDLDSSSSEEDEAVSANQTQPSKIRPNHSISSSESEDGSEPGNVALSVNSNSTTFLWRHSGQSTAPVIEPFTGISGVQTIPTHPNNPLSVASLFLTEELFELLVLETNRYRVQNNPPPKSNKYRKWTDVTVSEMKIVIGLWIITGQVKKPTLRMYWSTDEIIATPFFGATMSRNRFEAIMQYMHFNDNNARPEDSDRLYKVQPILDVIMKASAEIYLPERNLALDEAMVAWRGRLVFRTYNPGKLVKYGILVRAVCDSATGYVCNFLVYTAKGTKLQDTVLKLCEPFYNKGYHVYMDNYYNNVTIAEALLQKGVRCCGTIRKNRGLPQYLKTEGPKLKKGETKFCQSNDILLQSWKDKRLVNMISTIHDASMALVSTRYQDREVEKPVCIAEYNKYMNGVDKADQNMSYYPFMRKTLKWTKKFFLYLMMLGLFNSYIVYKKLNEGTRPMKFQKYLLEVGRALCNKFSIAETEGLDSGEVDPPQPSIVSKRAPYKRDSQYRLSGDMSKHKISPILPTNKKLHPTRKCRVCINNKRRSETRYICISCEVPLCKVKCFTLYHTSKRYF